MTVSFRGRYWLLLGLVAVSILLGGCDSPISQEVKTTGSILVTFSPDDADVSVERLDEAEEQVQGLEPQQTGSSLHYLKPPGDYLVTVAKEGYQTQTRTLSLEASEIISLTIYLEKDDGEGPPPSSDSIAAIIAADERFDILEAALDVTELTALFEADGDYTLFAPTDDALEALLTEVEISLEEFLEIPGLDEILKYHATDERLGSADLLGISAFTTLQGSDVLVDVLDGEIFLNGTVGITESDIAASNGLVHALDAILLPDSGSGESDYESSPNKAFGENQETVSDSIKVTEEGFVTNLEVMLEIAHEWVGDLIVELEHVESGNLMTLVAAPPSGLDNIALTLSDAAELDIQNDVVRGVGDSEAFPADNYTPFEPLRFAYGTPLAGEWKLTVTDIFPSLDDGTFRRWGLKVMSQSEQPEPALALAPLRGLSTTLAQGFTETSAVKVRRLSGLSGPVTVSLEDSGGGVSAETVILAADENEAGLRVEVSPSALTSERDISLVAQSGEVTDSYAFRANVVKPDSKDVELLAHLPLADIGELGGSGNDSWGWTDPDTGKEYALVGTSGGTAFVDISTPTAPVYLGSLPTHTDPSFWRDIKVYKNHAFIVSEADGHGMQVFDLSQLRSATGVTAFTETAYYGEFGNAHNIAINEATGFAYVVGATQTEGYPNVCDGGLFMIDLSTPTSPAFAGCFAGGVPEGKEPGDAYPTDVYVHDAQCVIYNGPDEAYQGREICITSDGQINEESEDYVGVVDVTDKANPVQLSRATYRDDTDGYSHQGWLTKDHTYFVFNDEADETGDSGTLSYVWDVSDLNDIKVMDTFSNPVDSIGHNVYIKDGFAYQANYTSGLRILDTHHISDTGLEEVAYFDTYPDDDNDDTPGDLQALRSSSSCASSDVRSPQARRHPEGRGSCGLAIFSGAWNNYPFFDSGVVVISDINRGLFLLKPNLHDHP